MRKYLFKKLLTSVLLIWVITVICFIFINLIPSDPAEVALRIRQTPVITETIINQVREELGLNDPFLVRYFHWLQSALKLDFGVSYVNPGRTVTGEIARALPGTLYLTGVSMVIIIFFSMILGVISGVFNNKAPDHWVRHLTFLSTSMPSYWSGLLLIWVFSVKLHVLPTSGSIGWKSVILPAITVSLVHIATYVRLIRSNIIHTLKEDFILYAHVRGLSKWNIIGRHVLKNSLQSSIAAFGMGIPQLIAGTLVVENIFAWPGLGTLCVSAVFNRDYPIIQVYVLLMGVLFVTSNFIFDLIQQYIDPRTRRAGA